MSEKIRNSNSVEWINRITNYILLSVLFSLFSLPVVTLGASLTALHYCTMRSITDKDNTTWRYFVKCFREKFVGSTIIWLIVAAVTLLLGADVLFFGGLQRRNGAGVASIFWLIGIILLCLDFMIVLYIFSIQAKVEKNISIQFKNALVISVKNLSATIILSIIVAVTVMIFAILPIPSILFFSFAGFGVYAYLYNILVLKCIAPNALSKKETTTYKEVKNEPQETDEKILDEVKITVETEEEIYESDNEIKDMSDESTKAAELTEEELPPVKKKKSIALSDADEDERNRILEEQNKLLQAELEAKQEAAREAQRVVDELVERASEDVTYETSGENVYRRTGDRRRHKKKI